MDGTIKRLVKDKGFGFIRAASGIEYFFHTSAVQNYPFESLDEGIDVTFEPGEGKKGPRAEMVSVRGGN